MPMYADVISAARASATMLEIFYLPENMSTLVAITAQSIETFAGVGKDAITDPAVIAAAFDAVERSKPVPEARPIDARYALIFFSAGGERVLRVYKGNFASHGQIDDATCAFDEPILDGWLRARYA